MKKLIRSSFTFDAYIEYRNSLNKLVKVKIHMPMGEYEVRKEFLTYFEVDKLVYYTAKDSGSEVLSLYPRIPKESLSREDSISTGTPDNTYWKVKTPYSGKTKVGYVSFINPDIKIDSKELFNEIISYFMGYIKVERSPMEDPEFDQYWWEDSLTGCTIWDGVEGVPYKGEAPPFDSDMNLLNLVIDKITSLRSPSGKSPSIISCGNIVGIKHFTSKKVYSVNDCSKVFEGSSFKDSLYLAISNFVTRYPNASMYES